MQNSPIINTDGNWDLNNTEIAIKFTEYLENTFKPKEGVQIAPIMLNRYLPYIQKLLRIRSNKNYT